MSKRTFLCNFFICLSWFVATIAVSAGDQIARLDQIVASYVKSNHFMGSVLVEKDGQVLLNKAYGFANLEWQVPNTTDTKFRVGSITKQFTAAAILLLEDQGKLRTNDHISKFLPNSPKAWEKITIYQLLTHRSGIPNYTDFPDFKSSQATKVKLDDLIKRFRDKPLDFEPGTQWNYSNSGYVLLGSIIQTVSGKTYASFLQENFFDPLEMYDTDYDYNSVVLNKRASGYTYLNGFYVNADFTDMSVPFAAGALYSTTADLLRWQKALFSSQVISAASVKKMTTSVTNRYAMGLFSAHLNNQVAWFHGGIIAGFYGELDYYPDSKLTVIVLGNVLDPVSTDIATNLAGVVLGRKVVLPSERKEVKVAQEVLAKYLGVFRFDPTFTMTLSLENGHLFATATGQSKQELFAESNTLFYFKDVEGQIEFLTNAKGEATGFVYTQDGNDIKVQKE